MVRWKKDKLVSVLQQRFLDTATGSCFLKLLCILRLLVALAFGFTTLMYAPGSAEWLLTYESCKMGEKQ